MRIYREVHSMKKARTPAPAVSRALRPPGVQDRRAPLSRRRPGGHRIPMQMKTKKAATKRNVTKKIVGRLIKNVRPKTSALRAGPAPVVGAVIAMAASAGGLNALSVILGGLPAGFPAALAIVMHVSPDHESILAEILNRRTHLTVKQAHTGDILCPGCVFVAPPNHHLFVAQGGRLKLSSSSAEKINYARPSAEPLFVSVAAIYRRDAIAVVLTGGDGDGSFGVQIIKDHGGQVIAQDRPTSQDFSMPKSSIETGDVDFVLPLDEIAAKLIELVGAGKSSTKGRAPAGKMRPPAVAKSATPRYAATPKAAMLTLRKTSA